MTAKPDAGFTLLEILVAVAVFGLVMVGLSGGLRFAGRAVVAEQRLVDGPAAVEPARALLRRLIGEAQSITGGPDRLELVAPLAAVLGDDRLIDIRLFVAGGRLVLAWNDGRTGAGQTDLFSDVAAASFSYRPAAGGWRPSSADPSKPPALIKLHVDFVTPSRALDVVAAPGADAPLLGTQVPRAN